MILLDTSALFYWTLDPDGLTSHAKEAIRESDKILVNAISLWEPTHSLILFPGRLVKGH